MPVAVGRPPPPGAAFASRRPHLGAPAGDTQSCRRSGEMGAGIENQCAGRMSVAVGRALSPGAAFASRRRHLGAPAGYRRKRSTGGNSMTPGFPGAALGIDGRGLAAVLNRLNLGKMNCTGTVTL